MDHSASRKGPDGVGVHQQISYSVDKAEYQRLRAAPILKYRSGLHRYIRTEMDFLGISSLGSAYRYAVKIEEKFQQKNKQDSGPANPPQKQGKGNPGLQNTIKENDNQSPPQEKKGDGKTKKDIGKWCEFHKIPWHNNDECRSKQSLVDEIKSLESNPDSDSESQCHSHRKWEEYH